MTGAASCRDCGRPLSDPASQARGVGPVCWGKGHPRPRRRRASAADQPITGFPELERKTTTGDVMINDDNTAKAQRWLDTAANNLVTVGGGLEPGEYIRAAAAIGFGYSQLAHLDEQRVNRADDLQRHAEERTADLERIAGADAKLWAHYETEAATSAAVAEAHRAMTARMDAERVEIEQRTTALAALDAAALGNSGRRERSPRPNDGD